MYPLCLIIGRGSLPDPLASRDFVGAILEGEGKERMKPRVQPLPLFPEDDAPVT